jgi:hypothetical protein
VGVVFEGGCGSFGSGKRKTPGSRPTFETKTLAPLEKRSNEFLREEKAPGKGIEWLGFADSGGRQIRLRNF